MPKPPYKNLVNHNDSNPSVDDLPKPTIGERMREILKTITLFVLSIVVFIFAVLVSAIGASLLGILYAGKETIEYLKGLFQKEKLFSSLWRLFSIGTSMVLGVIVAAVIFPPGAGVIIGACIVLGWTLGLTAFGG